MKIHIDVCLLLKYPKHSIINYNVEKINKLKSLQVLNKIIVFLYSKTREFYIKNYFLKSDFKSNFAY